MRTSVLGAVLAASCAATWLEPPTQAQTQAGPPAAAGPPRLVVVLVVDQLRADYVTMYGEAWTGGLKEILTKGASFTEAAYPYAVNKTCSGHVTIGTGVLPSSHGMIDNTWYDKTTHEFLNCTEDHKARALPFGSGTSDESHSARLLAVPSFADELKRQVSGRPRVVSLSLKARSAIGLGGRGGTDSTIVWKDEDSVTFATSDALTKRPSEAVEAYVRAHPIAPEPIMTWDRTRPAPTYKFDDQAPGEPNGRQPFPHLFDEPIRVSDATPDLLDSWDNTPLADEYLADLAAHLIDRERLGQRQTVDYLAIGFSVLDIVGHEYGPRSHEVQDVMVRLDAAVGRLLATLDARVGRDKYVLALSSDHGVAMLPEQSFPTPGAAAGGRGPGPAGGRGQGQAGGGGVTGRLTNATIGNAVEAALDKQFGRGTYVEAIAVPYLYFRPGVLDRVRANASAMQAVEAAATGVRGVAKVYWSADIASTAATADSMLAAFRKSYFPGRSGDLAFVLDRNWVNSAGTNHGMPYDYDQRVPVVLFGAGIAAGQHTTPASPVDIVPTLSALTGVRMPRTDGRVLREALASTGTR